MNVSGLKKSLQEFLSEYFGLGIFKLEIFVPADSKYELYIGARCRIDLGTVDYLSEQKVMDLLSLRLFKPLEADLLKSGLVKSRLELKDREIRSVMRTVADLEKKVADLTRYKHYYDLQMGLPK